MTKLAHVVGGVIAEFPGVDPAILATHPAMTLEDCYPADFLAALATVPDAAQVGWTWDGKVAAAPLVVPPTPVVRLATTYQLMSALTDAQRAAYPGPIKAWDQRLFSARDTPWPETNEKIGRIADALGTSPRAWFDRVFAAVVN